MKEVLDISLDHFWDRYNFLPTLKFRIIFQIKNFDLKRKIEFI